MTNSETKVAAHYTTGALYDRVIDGLKAMGVDPDAATADDLKLGDEFHTGGVLATDHLMDQLTITPDMRVLDVGCGIGGTSRYIADRTGAHETGVDLTPEFVDTAKRLSALVGLSARTQFHVDSALEMPVADASFDLAVMMHVGMNIPDKDTLLAQVSAKLKPGGRFALFEVMAAENPEPLVFPVPWSSVPETSFLAPPTRYVTAAEAAGLNLVVQNDRTEFAKAFFAEAFSKPPAPLGIHLMMGDTAKPKLVNYVANLDAARLTPVEMIFDKAA